MTKSQHSKPAPKPKDGPALPATPIPPHIAATLPAAESSPMPASGNGLWQKAAVAIAGVFLTVAVGALGYALKEISDTKVDVGKIADRSDRTAVRLSEIENRLDRRLDALDRRFDTLDGRLDALALQLARIREAIGVPSDAGVNHDAGVIVRNAAIEAEVARLRLRYPGVAITRTHRGSVWGYWVEFADGAVFRVLLGADGVFRWFTPQSEPARAR